MSQFKEIRKDIVARLACSICGDDSEAAKVAASEYSLLVPGATVCGDCAERVANSFSMRHSGEWLTWPNDSQRPSKPKKGVIRQSLRTAVFERDKYRCLRCGTHVDLRADHVFPESKGGEATLENLQTLCLPCNSWKGTKTIDFRSAS